MRMSVKDWIAVEDNPIQRDTERHAAKAKHLLTPLPTHSFVFAAQLPNGKLIKLDGHTRALMWKRGQIVSPVIVEVGVVPVKDRAHAEELYKTFDSREALETVRDKVSGAFNRFGFDPQSGLLQAGNLTHALRVAWRVLQGYSAASVSNKTSSESAIHLVNKADVYTMIKEFNYELGALDGYGLGQGQASSGIVAAFILSYRRYGHKITPFWTGVFGNSGSKIAGEMDAIQAVNEMILARRGKHYGGTATTELCSRTLTAIEKWLKDENLYRQPTPMDTLNYLAGHEKPSERLIKKADHAKK